MTLVPFPLVGTAYADEARPFSSQRCVNYILEPSENEGTRSRAKLVGVPGLAAFSRGMQEAPVRGLHNVEGLILAVAGDMLYRINPQAVAIPIGTVPGTGRVEMEHNQIQYGYEVLISNGQGGYVYNTYADTYEPITDPGFPGSGITSPFFLDGYLGGVDRQGRYIAHSELRQAMEWNTLDRFAAEARPDKIVLARAFDRRLLALGDSSGQFFRNTGALTGTFQNESGTEFSVGAASRYAAEVVDSAVVWLGSDGLVYTLQGASPVILSTGPIADAMAEHDLSTCFTMLWEDGKHKVVYFSFPQGRTYGLDLWTRTWHTRESYGLDRWRVSALVRWGKKWLAGDYANGRLYWLDWDVQTEYDQPLVRKRTTGPIHADDNPILVNRLRIIADTGKPTKDSGEFPVPPVGPTITGDAPGGTIGFAYEDFQYIVTEGDSPIASVAVVAGALPAGLSLDNSGLLTGTPTAGGTFTWTVRVTDEAGLRDEVADNAEIATGVWWMTGAESSNPRNSLWISFDVTDWSDAILTTRTQWTDPSGGVGGGGYYQSSGLAAVIVGGSGQAEYTADLDPTGAVTTSLITVFPSSGPRRVRVIGNRIFAFETNANLASYEVTENGGATWTQLPAPGSLRITDIGRLNNGRWMCRSSQSSTLRFYYSDDSGLPVTWTQGVGAPGNPGACLLSNGEVAITFGTGQTFYRTADGETWATASRAQASANDGLVGACDGDIFVFGDTNSIVLHVTEDAGLTWVEVPFRNCRRIDVYDGMWVACCPGNGGGIFYSTDPANTWTAATLPPGVGSGFYSSLFVAPISLEVSDG